MEVRENSPARLKHVSTTTPLSSQFSRSASFLEASRSRLANLRHIFRQSIQIFLLIVAAGFYSPLFGLDPQKNIDQYGHDTWTSQNGLPGEAVYQILQSQDGYLWLRTSAGLVRFDGVRFVLVDPVVENHAVDEPVRAICIGADGDLLIRTTSRTLTYNRGAFADYRPAVPLPDGEIRNIFESKEHEVFIGSDDFIYVIQGGDLKMLRRGTGWINGFLNSSGKIWIGSGGANPLYVDADGEISPIRPNIPDASALAAAPDQHIWVGTMTGLFLMDPKQAAIQRIAPDKIKGEVNSIISDRQGNLWVGTSDLGLVKITNSKVSSFSSQDGLSDSKAITVYEDREGSLWVGTTNGLDRFRDTALTTLTVKEGLPSNYTTLAMETREGILYILSRGGGLARIQNGVVTALTRKDGLQDTYGDGMFESKDGSLWMGSTDGPIRFQDGKFKQFDHGRLFKRYVSAVSGDNESLIVTTSETLALRLKNGREHAFTFEGKPTPLSRAGNYTFTIYPDRSGTLWFGTVKGLFKFAKGESPDSARQPQIDFPVTSIFDDHRGSLWLGGRIPGLTRFRISDGRVTRYTRQSGLFDDYPSCVLADDKADLWISTSNGIFMVSKRSLDDFADGRVSVVPSLRFGTADGMKTSEASQPESQPGGARTRDGRLWFTTQKGIVVVDPNHILQNDLVPPVVIEALIVDGKALSSRQDIRLAAGTDKIEIQYTALSLRIPRRVQFKYKLEGYDRDWVNAGSRRVAY